MILYTKLVKASTNFISVSPALPSYAPLKKVRPFNMCYYSSVATCYPSHYSIYSASSLVSPSSDMISVHSNRKYGKGIELGLLLLIELLSSINRLTEKLNAVFLTRIKVLVVLLYCGFLSTVCTR
jgi:hypothetical protein